LHWKWNGNWWKRRCLVHILLLLILLGESVHVKNQRFFEVSDIQKRFGRYIIAGGQCAVGDGDDVRAKVKELSYEGDQLVLRLRQLTHPRDIRQISGRLECGVHSGKLVGQWSTLWEGGVVGAHGTEQIRHHMLG
jgi:hypothetical protein